MAYRDNPVIFWDLFAQQGHPVRTTISEMGPLLLARLMGLNEVQEGVLAIAFRIADEQNLLLLDLGDLQAMLMWCAENADELTTKYGNVSKATVGTIQRQLLTSRARAARISSATRARHSGHDPLRREWPRLCEHLAADKLMAAPNFTRPSALAAQRDVSRRFPRLATPTAKLVFFFDEAHLLFDDAPPALAEKIEQVVRLIRSKGSASISSRRIRSTFRKMSRASSATASSTRCARSPRATRSGQGRRRNLPPESEDRCRARDYRASGRRGAGVVADGRWARRRRVERT